MHKPLDDAAKLDGSDQTRPDDCGCTCFQTEDPPEKEDSTPNVDLKDTHRANYR